MAARTYDPKAAAPPTTSRCESAPKDSTLDIHVPGVLDAWARTTHTSHTSRGSWLAGCTFTIPTGNNRGCLEVTQWCPAAVIPCEPGPVSI
ncbi:hypothetical protein [Rhodococcus jostii]|uniref:hypothetical protein n=1 Tax=Rhodococcus jostii TaxID=132919 RepID=UPI003650DC7B